MERVQIHDNLRIAESYRSEVPHLVVDKSLETAPYNVDVNLNECADFLEENGLEPNEIKNLRISLKREFKWSINKRFFNPLGTYKLNYDHPEITLYTDRIWNDPRKLRSKEDENNKTQVFTTHPAFLRSPKPQEDIMVSDDDIVQAVNETANQVLQHEMGHFIFSQENPVVYNSFSMLQVFSFPARELPAYEVYERTGSIPLTVATGIACFFLGGRAYYRYVDPHEKVASSYEQAEDAPNRQLITLSPREYQTEPKL